MIDLFFVNSDNLDAQSLAIKMAGPHKSGEIIFLTDGEMDCLRGGDVQRLTNPSEEPGNFQIIEIDPEKTYLAICKPGFVNLNDINNLNEIGFKITIIRTK